MWGDVCVCECVGAVYAGSGVGDHVRGGVGSDWRVGERAGRPPFAVVAVFPQVRDTGWLAPAPRSPGLVTGAALRVTAWANVVTVCAPWPRGRQGARWLRRAQHPVTGHRAVAGATPRHRAPAPSFPGRAIVTVFRIH